MSEPDMGPSDSEVPKANERGELNPLSTGGRQTACTVDCWCLQLAAMLTELNTAGDHFPTTASTGTLIRQTTS